MTWRDSLLAHLGPGLLHGITLGDLLRLLRENEFAIDRPYWWRAAIIALNSVNNSVLRRVENIVFGQRIRAARVLPPIFVLGHWRSGTTHLHNLVTVDSRFAYPNFYQVVNPHTFLLTEAIGAKLLARFLPTRWPQDVQKLSFQAPSEDEFALCAATCLSLCLSWVFCRRSAHYDRYITFREVPGDEIARWKESFVWFVKKLTLKYGKPIVLKSPGHTARIRLLIDLFPHAKFIHICRNPYAVFQSARQAVLKNVPYKALQEANSNDVDDWTIKRGKQIYDCFFEERGLIPKGHLHEIRYEELDRDPIGQMRQLYGALELPDFRAVEPALRDYVQSLRGHKNNHNPRLSPGAQARIAREWRRYFEEWGYPLSAG